MILLIVSSLALALYLHLRNVPPPGSQTQNNHYSPQAPVYPPVPLDRRSGKSQKITLPDNVSDNSQLDIRQNQLNVEKSGNSTTRDSNNVTINIDYSTTLNLNNSPINSGQSIEQLPEIIAKLNSHKADALSGSLEFQRLLAAAIESKRMRQLEQRTPLALDTELKELERKLSTFLQLPQGKPPKE